MSDALRLENVRRVYKTGGGDLEVFRNLNLTLNEGELVALVGPSGAGKSSLLHMAGLLEAPSSGEVYIMGAPASTLPDTERTRIRRDTIGFVYQAHHLLPEFSALENVVMPMRIAGRPRAESQRDAGHILSHLGLGERLTHRPAHRPRILLADEPTGNLDTRTSGGVFEALIDLVRSEGLAALVATHNLELAARMDRIVMLQDGQLIDAGKLPAHA